MPCSGYASWLGTSSRSRRRATPRWRRRAARPGGSARPRRATCDVLGRRLCEPLSCSRAFSYSPNERYMSTRLIAAVKPAGRTGRCRPRAPGSRRPPRCDLQQVKWWPRCVSATRRPDPAQRAAKRGVGIVGASGGGQRLSIVVPLRRHARSQLRGAAQLLDSVAGVELNPRPPGQHEQLDILRFDAQPSSAACRLSPVFGCVVVLARAPRASSTVDPIAAGSLSCGGDACAPSGPTLASTSGRPHSVIWFDTSADLDLAKNTGRPAARPGLPGGVREEQLVRRPLRHSSIRDAEFVVSPTAVYSTRRSDPTWPDITLAALSPMPMRNPLADPALPEPSVESRQAHLEHFAGRRPTPCPHGRLRQWRAEYRHDPVAHVRDQRASVSRIASLISLRCGSDIDHGGRRKRLGKRCEPSQVGENHRSIALHAAES